jgi:hypothetical protein
VTGLLLAGGIGVYSTATKEDQSYANLQIVSSDAAFGNFNSIEELENYSQVVVLGKFTGKRTVPEK